MLINIEDINDAFAQLEALYPYGKIELRMCEPDLLGLIAEIKKGLNMVVTKHNPTMPPGPPSVQIGEYHVVALDLKEYAVGYTQPQFYVQSKDAKLPVPLAAYVYRHGYLHQTHLPKHDKLLMAISEHYRPR